MISIDRDTVTILREHLRRQAEERQAAGSAWTDDGGLVFTTKWGEPLYPDTVTALMTKLINTHNRSVTCPRQALPHARLHDLRHLHATTLLLAGVPVHIVAARLGHADPAVTLRVYSHVLREHALGIGDISLRQSRLPLANPLASRIRRADETGVVLVKLVVRGRVELPTFRFSGEI